MADEIPAHVRQTRVENARTMVVDARNRRRDARMFALLAEDPDHLMDADTAADLAEQAARCAAEAEAAATFAGTTVDDLVRKMKRQRLDELKGQVREWSRLRDVHADMRDNPEGYGGTDLGGQPLDVDVQDRYVREYTAAITAAEEEVAQLEGTAEPAPEA